MADASAYVKTNAEIQVYDDDVRAEDVAGQWQLMWWRFKRHKVAVIAGICVLFIYLVGIFAEFLSPMDPNDHHTRYTYAPPQNVDLFHDGQWLPHVKGYQVEIDQFTLRRTFVTDEEKIIPIGLFVKGDEYKMWGLIPWDRHLIGPLNPRDPFYLWGADRLGRDMLSRVIHGARVSMSIGLVGVAISLVLGIILGGISGYFGGWIDNAIQRIIEFLKSIPTIPLWMGLAAAIPLTWEPLYVYFAITVLISLIGWTGLAREVRGKVISMKGDDFVIAARLDGLRTNKIITRHLVPSFLSHIIAQTTLAIPDMILSETALSFLGIGLQPPIVSWGVLLKEAQNINAVATAPWLMIPGLAVVFAVLTLNFLGDGMRDAADPYSHH
ncbi:ABC transporter permease [Pseudaestuariivita rosea]|uniref:ABC transporter permease n=1 Tax=Pseudaestuariivita rosea TaxID=2763263 RepID=UPI001ABB7C3C|nr:ABC transporter permease [Pseudaestuariivita rosea]